jgi:nucleoside-diphosphate-sugar epimerase
VRRTLVTGGTGFVGANLTRRLLRDGHRVDLLVRPGYASWRIDEIAMHIRLHETDLADVDGLARVVRNVRPDWVFHLATYGAYPTQANLEKMMHTNILGTINLIEVCRRQGFEAFVNTGSSSEYGVKDHAPSEREWLEPNSYYAVSKASATLFCRYTAQAYGLHMPTLRLYSVYGPYEEPSRLIPMLVTRGLVGELPPLADPKVAHDYVYVDDVCEAYALAAAARGGEPGAIYNVGTGVQTQLSEVVALARRLLGVAREPAWGSLPNRAWDSIVWIADARAAANDLGWAPRHTLEHGLRHTVDWFRHRRNVSG